MDKRDITAPHQSQVYSLFNNTLFYSPSKYEILGRYATAIGLHEGSSEWYLFFDLAASDHGIIPRDLLEDEEVVKMLPVFFRTLRGQKPTENEMRDLAEKLKRR